MVLDDSDCLGVGAYFIECYGNIQFHDDLDHARTYYHYGHIVADVMESLRTTHFKEVVGSQWEDPLNFRSRYNMVL